MKILFTGGGTGGHFYPIIAVADALHEVAKERKLVQLQLYYMADSPYNAGLLFDKGIDYRKITAGKKRTYFSLLNYVDFFKTCWGVVNTLTQVFGLYPDVVFSKGGYVSFPVLVAARILRIPVVIHESDTVPGRVNLWSGKFARSIAVSYPEATKFFPKEKVAVTGNPIRAELIHPIENGVFDFLQLDPNIPVILVLGGSQGAALINENLIDTLPELVKKYQIVHQTGKKNFNYVKTTTEVTLRDSQYKSRYKTFEYLNDLALRMAAGSAALIVTRAGSTLFEIASWGIPSIVIPITDSHGDHQRQNAYAYARTGAGTVIEEVNLTSHILASEIERIMSLPGERERMKDAAKAFARPNAANVIANEIVKIGLEHEA